jgi:hypothetical protein
MSGPTPGDWRYQANPKSPPFGGNAKFGKRAWQAQTDAPKTPRKALSRGSKLAMAALALSAIVGGVIAVVLWLRPAKPATLILLGASYDDNLTLPHNAAAWRGILDLEEVSGSHSLFTQAGRISRAHGPVDLRGAKWDKEWAKVPTNVKEESVIFVLGLHGSVKDGKAFLHFDDDRGLEGVTFEQVIKDLAASPLAKKNVLLVLEPALHRSNWATGMLHNDFVRKLKENEKLITDQPNLLVLCASDADQVSWDSPEWRRTIFMHYLIEGLQGAADGNRDERVTPAELYEFVRKRVQEWSQANRGVLQTPILLGRNSKEAREGLVQVKSAYKERTPDEAPGKSATLPLDDIESVWRSVAEMRNAIPAPAVYAPQLWRAFQELTLRYEQLACVGFPAQKLSDMKARLRDMEKTLRDRATLEAAAPVRIHSLPMATALGLHPGWNDAELRQQFQTLWDGRKGDKVRELAAEIKKWAAAQSTGLDAKDFDSLLAVHLLRHLLGQVAMSSGVEPADFVKTDDGEKQARKLLDRLEAELKLTTRPAEAHYLVMLDQDLDPRAIKDHAATKLVQLAVEVRLLAEQASLGVSSPREHPYSEVVFARVRGMVDAGDTSRRLGEDYLFGSDKQHFDLARQHFLKAKTNYQDALEASKVIRDALGVRDRALADLPFFARWLANQRPTIDMVREGERTALQAKVESMAQAAREITIELAKDNAVAADLKAPASRLAQEHRDLKAAFAKECEDLTPEVHLQKRWHEIEAALSVPLLVEDGKDPVGTRMNLLRNRRSTSGKFHAGGIETKGTMVPQEQEATLLVKWTAREKKLARTALTPFVTFATADDPIQKHLQQMVESIGAGLRASLETADLATAADELAKAEWLCRGLPGGLEKLTPREPFTVPEGLRRLRWHDLLLWQAERTLYDHWYGDRDSSEQSYYEPAARVCAKTAQTLSQEGVQENDMRVARAKSKKKFGKREQPGSQELLDKIKGAGLEEIAPSKFYWTTEREFPITWKITPQDDAYLKPFGAAMYQVAKGGAEAAPRRAWTEGDGVVRFPLPEKEKPAQKASVNLVVRYRGQLLEAKAEVLPKSPDRIDYVFPPGDKAGIAVRMDKDFTYGAIAIMLDCSGSMTEKYKGGTRFDQAASALGKLLAVIPKNTYVSLTVFIKTASDNAPKFQLLREPEEWQSEHAAPLMNLVRNLGKQIDPTGLSPIARGMVKALEQGFPGVSRNYSGPKLLIALTDGDDNFSFGTFARSADHNQDVKKLLTDKFRDSGVKTHVVCFLDPNSDDKDVQREARNAEEQFGVFTNRKLFDPVGRFVLQPDGDKLAKELQDAIRPRFKLVRNVEIERFVGEPGRELQWNPVSPGKYQLSLEGEDKIDVQLAPGDRMLVILKRRNDRKLLYERALMRDYANTKFVEKEQSLTLVSILQNHETLQDNRLHQLVSVEDLTRRTWLEHRQPGFCWIETSAHPDKKYKSGKPSLLESFRDHRYPAPAFRLLMRGWPLHNPSEVRLWWTSDDASAQPWSKSFDVSPKGSGPKEIEVAKTLFRIEGVTLETHLRAPDFGETPVSKQCLVVRVQHPPDKPVRIQLTNDHEGEEHHTFTSDDQQTPGKYTAFFWGIGEGERWNLNLISLADFKQAAETARFEPDLSQVAPQDVSLK